MRRREEPGNQKSVSLTSEFRSLADWWPPIAFTAAAIATIPVAFRALAGTEQFHLHLPWDRVHGDFVLGLDPLSAFFLLPILVLAPLCAAYASAYFRAERGPRLQLFWSAFAIFIAGMVLVLLARTAVIFLAAWEIMSIAAFFLTAFDDHKPETRRAAWVFLVASHAGVAFLIAAFLLLGRYAGGLDFETFARASLPPTGATAIFLLALAGFGAKAGFVPLHFWLPEAHPAAPSPVSALMSGVMIKMGLYGLMRMLTFLDSPASWWGLIVAALGVGSALVGATLASGEVTLKRALAYSSIENMGLIGIALGLGLWGKATGNTIPAVLGASAALLHVWNHAAMKGLLFLAAGAVVHATHTGELDQLGGLMKRMPHTSRAVMLGAVAICGLPPFAGFVSEWLILVALAKTGLLATNGASLAALLAVGFVALSSGIIALAFVRLVGISLLGLPRSQAAAKAHDPAWGMRVPVAILAAFCVLPALAPRVVLSTLAPAVEQLQALGWAEAWDEAGLDSAVGILGAMNGALIASVAAAALGLRWIMARRPLTRRATWGCGYPRPTPRMQYTARSFSEMLGERIAPRFLRPRVSTRGVEGWFPTAAKMEIDAPDPFTARIYEPLLTHAGAWLARVQSLLQGDARRSLVYLLAALVAAFAWLGFLT